MMKRLGGTQSQSGRGDEDKNLWSRNRYPIALPVASDINLTDFLTSYVVVSWSVNSEVERMCKNVVVASFNILSRLSPQETWNSPRPSRNSKLCLSFPEYKSMYMPPISPVNCSSSYRQLFIHARYAWSEHIWVWSCLSVCLSVRMIQLNNCWTDFD
jgi:hypothetical protein